MSDPRPPTRLHDPMCMVCGPENPNSLGMRVLIDGDRVLASAELAERHGGAPGFAHGGALSAFIDDLFGYVLVVIDRPAVTAKLEVEFRAPAMLGAPIEMVAWCDRIEGRKLHLRGEIRQGQALVVEAGALFIHVDVSHWASSGVPLPDGWHTWGTGTTE